MLRRSLQIFCGAVALAALACTGSIGEATPPERIVSLRQRYLSPERYRELEKEWRAYTEAHPNDPLGWSQLAKAARYAGKECTEYVPYAEKAVRLGPNHAEALATMGAYRWVSWCDGQPREPLEAIAMLERALKLDPTLDDPHYSLWTLRLSLGLKEAATRELRALLDAGRIPEPLLDFGYNLLIGLEPNAILLTNGDNDTYPLVALQSCRGVRPDVAVVNLSMLNLGWYRRDWRKGPAAVPVPLLGQDPGNVTEGPAALAGLIENLGKHGWKRPLYAACTVNLHEHSIPNRLSLEGIVYRVLPKSGTGTEVDIKHLTRNLREVYRLETVTSPALDWEAWSSVRQLMLNYVAAEYQLAAARRKAGDRPGARESMVRALTLSEFHSPSVMRELAQQWSTWDSGTPELARWKKKAGI